MPLILAVDRDRRQVNQLVSLVKRLNVELVPASSAAEGLEALAGRIPDLILTSSLLSPKEDGVLAGHLRELGPRASHVQTLTIPVLKSSRPRRSKSGVLSKLRRENAKASLAPEGCDPELFAEEIRLYLQRAAEEQEMKAAHHAMTPSSVVEEEPQASFEGLEPQPSPPASAWQEFEAEEYPAIEDAIADSDAVAQVDAIVALEPEREEASVLLDESSDLISSSAPTTIDQSPLSSLGLAYHETVRAAEAFGDPAAEADVSLREDESGSGLVAEVDSAERDPVSFVEEVYVNDEPATAIPIDRLVALFADLEPLSIEVMDQPADVVSQEAVIDDTSAVAEQIIEEMISAPELMESPEPAAPMMVDASHEQPANASETEPPASPVLDEETLVSLGEAAWKATFREGLLKDLGLTPEAKKAARHASSKANGHEPERSSKLEAAAPDEESKGDERAVAAATPDAARKEKENRSKKKGPRGKTKEPAQDEWGLFDPDQCGFSALVEKLDKVTEEPEEQRPRTGTRVRVISY